MAFGIVLAFCVWAHHNPPFPSIVQCLADPSGHDGAVVSTGSGGAVEAIEKSGFRIARKSGKVLVRGRAEGIKKGDFVFLEAVFHKEGYFELKRIYNSRYRHLRIAASLAGLLWVILIFFRSYRFDPSRFLFIQRNDRKTTLQRSNSLTL
jgi:hypothetical protein